MVSLLMFPPCPPDLSAAQPARAQAIKAARMVRFIWRGEVRVEIPQIISKMRGKTKWRRNLSSGEDV
jgi:hypothetical protein